MSNNAKMQEGAPSAQSSINENFAFALDYFMKTEKYGARELARKCDVNVSAIYKWKRGDACPGFRNLVLLADEFGCSIDCLIGREPIENDYGFISKTAPKPFCDNFNEILSEKGLTEYRLVKMMGVSRTKISSWRKGNSLPDAKGLCDLADALDVSADSLAGRI